MQSDEEKSEAEKRVEERQKKREAKKKKRMPISGKSVFEIERIKKEKEQNFEDD
jgi:hypothetical protein